MKDGVLAGVPIKMPVLLPVSRSRGLGCLYVVSGYNLLSRTRLLWIDLKKPFPP